MDFMFRFCNTFPCTKTVPAQTCMFALRYITWTHFLCSLHSGGFCANISQPIDTKYGADQWNDHYTCLFFIKASLLGSTARWIHYHPTRLYHTVCTSATNSYYIYVSFPDSLLWWVALCLLHSGLMTLLMNGSSRVRAWWITRVKALQQVC